MGNKNSFARRLVGSAFAVLLALGAVGCGQGNSASDVAQPEAETSNVQEEQESQEGREMQEEQEPVLSYDAQKDRAVEALVTRLEDMRRALYVYRDFSDTQNHFTQPIKMAGADMDEVRDLDMNCQQEPHSGASCIRCEHKTASGSWGGWMFSNGYVPAGQIDPVASDSTADSAGMDLSGATELRFCARGDKGGEIVEFFCAGFGYDGETNLRTQPNADSTVKRSLGRVTLSREWQEYTIGLTGADLSCIACGFGYAIDDADYAGADAVFYLDDIRYEGDIACLDAMPMMIRSYDTETIQLKNAAYTYDNALAAMALMSEGRTNEAEDLLDAMVYAVQHDRYKSGRIRNAYAAGDLAPAPGWGDAARLPGWYDTKAGEWYEDAYQVGANVGNTSYAALALLHYKDGDKADTYLQTAQTLMDWVLSNCADDGEGFTAGYDGWPESGDDVTTTHTYKSTEHNLDAYAAFTELYARTKDERYAKGAKSALAFVQSMYDAKEGLFYTGTTSDGKTPEVDNVVLDAQVWSALALGDEFEPYQAALDRLASMRTPAGGYRFHVCDEDQYWCEGTAFTALMHVERGELEQASTAFEALANAQLDSGLFPAATSDGLTTGIYLSDGTPWTYGMDAHVAPTAWFVMACNGFNPYTF